MIKSWILNCTLLLGTILVFFVIGEVYARAAWLESDKIIALNPCVGFKDVPGTQATFGTKDSPLSVSINSAGYRDVEHAVAKAPGTYRILMLGDSFTEGLQVNPENLFWRQMQKKMDEEGLKVEVMSMGVSSYGTNQELLTYECFGRQYKPDLVILHFTNANDPVDNYFRRGAFEPQFTLASETLALDETYKATIAAQNKRHSTLPWGPVFWLKEHSKALQYLYDRVQVIQGNHTLGTIVDGTNQIYLKKYTPEWQKAWNLTDALLHRLIADVKADGAQFVLVDIPGIEELEPTRVIEPLKYDLTQPDVHLRALAEKEGVPYINLFPALAEAHKVAPVNWTYDAHWNPNGHTVTAEVLLAKLKELFPQIWKK